MDEKHLARLWGQRCTQKISAIITTILIIKEDHSVTLSIMINQDKNWILLTLNQ